MKNLLLLHGALGASSQFTALAGTLDASKIYTLDFSGHGNAGFQTAFSIPQFAQEVLAYLDEHNLISVDIFGYSMGGFVALYLALHHPGRVGKIISLAAKLDWNETIAAKETAMLNPDKIEAKVPQFAADLALRHQALSWKTLMNETALMMQAMGADNPIKPADYAAINAPVLLLLGDSDKMVSLEETFTAFKALPNAQLGILPATPHPLEQVNLTVLAAAIRNFLGNDQ